ncbi:hypothetical protein Leryth_007723 [Lithospermum erythrorhizon]|nr:hypothetical protein Leryth_007723 [Lithospermum erythrorhizon]
MAQIQKLEIQAKIKSSPRKIFYIYKNKGSLMPKIVPNKVQMVKVIEGDGTCVGSIRLWTYNMEVFLVVAKDRIEAVDEENQRITFEVIGGEVTNYFKSFKATLQTKFEHPGNFIKWTLEYEKVDENVPTPHNHLEFLVELAKDVDSYLLRN